MKTPAAAVVAAVLVLAIGVEPMLAVLDLLVAVGCVVRRVLHMSMKRLGKSSDIMTASHIPVSSVAM